jgi:hypothetical protein
MRTLDKLKIKITFIIITGSVRKCEWNENKNP